MKKTITDLKVPNVNLGPTLMAADREELDMKDSIQDYNQVEDQACQSLH